MSSDDESILEESDQAPDASVTIPESQREIFAKQLDLALASVGKGVAKGKSADFGIFGQTNIFEKYINILGGILSGSIPSTRDLETQIKTETGFAESPSKVNEAAKRSVRKIVSSADAISRDNFEYYQKLLEQFPVSENTRNIAIELNSGKEAFDATRAGVELKSSIDDSPIWSEGSAYRTILKEVIPEIRSRFDLIARAYDKTPTSIASTFLLGTESEFDKSILDALYYAIARWNLYTRSLLSIRVLSDNSNAENQNDAAIEDESRREVTTDDLADLDILISEPLENNEDFIGHSGNPGEYLVDFDLEDDSRRYIDMPISGPDAKKAVSANMDGKDLFNLFIKNQQIILANESINYNNIIKDFSLEIEGKTPVLRVFLNSRDEVSRAGGLVPYGEDLLIIRSSTRESSFYKIVVSQNIVKESSEATSPLYQATSPDGEVVSFTPADLVAGRGRIRGRGGKSFKPKNIRSKSLADRVNSSSFGKVKTRKKRKK